MGSRALKLANFSGSKATFAPPGNLSAGLQFYADLWHPEQQGFLLSFDGNDYLSNATADFRSADSQGAIEVWVRTSATTSQSIISSADTAGNNNYLHLNTQVNTGKIQIARRNGDADITLLGTVSLIDGKFHHVVLSSDGSTYTIFIDGVAESLSGGVNTGDWFADITLRDNLVLGALSRNVGIAGYITGEIGFTRIYSRPMLQPEAQLNYQRGRKSPASDTTGLVFNLPCAEGTGNPVDTVGSLTMTATGATWGEGLMDRSTNALPLTSFGSPTWSNQGRTLALNKYIVSANTNLNFTSSAFSFLAWVKSTDLTAVNQIISRGLASTDGWGFHITAAGALTFVTNQAAATQSSFSDNAAILVNTWYMVGFSRNGASGKVWKNAVDVTTTSGNHTNPLTSARTVKLGAYDNLSLALIGTLDSPLTFNRELTTQEFLQIYNATKWRYGL